MALIHEWKYSFGYSPCELASAISIEDDYELKAAEKSIQDLTDKYIKMVDATVDKKSKEIMVI